jgi:hypothetical protein
MVYINIMEYCSAIQKNEIVPLIGKQMEMYNMMLAKISQK